MNSPARTLLSTAHLDYLRRTCPTQAPHDGAPFTRAPPELRRLSRVTSIGRNDKGFGERSLSNRIGEDLLAGLYGYKIPVALLLLSDKDGVLVHIGTWASEGRQEPP